MVVTGKKVVREPPVDFKGRQRLLSDFPWEKNGLFHGYVY